MKYLCCTRLFVFLKNALTIFGEIFDLHVSGVYKDLLTAPEAKESHIRFSSSLRWSNHYSGLLGTKGFLSCETFVHVSCIWPVVCYYLRLGLCMSDVKKSLEDTFQPQQVSLVHVLWWQKQWYLVQLQWRSDHPYPISHSSMN